MQYTIDNLKTQLANLNYRISQDEYRFKEAMKVDFPPAVNYGEDIRINHIKMINSRLRSMRKQALELRFKIEDMESEQG